MQLNREVLKIAVKQWLYQCRRNATELMRYGYYPRFLLPWLWLKFCYLLDSPYAVSRRYQRKIKSMDVYVYGETPLETLEHIADRANVTVTDHVFELGAGSGFTSLWLQGVRKCKVTAVEQVPQFCWRLHRTAKRMGLMTIDVRCESYLDTDLKQASVIYLYGSNLEDDVILGLVERFSSLQPGTRFITISYPLSDFSDKGVFNLKDQFSAQFEWGVAEVFIQEKAP